MKITFYHTALNSKGEPYQAVLMTISLPPGLSKEQALATATAQFQREMQVKHWQDLAESYRFDY
jgi:hypothetical protein